MKGIQLAEDGVWWLFSNSLFVMFTFTNWLNNYLRQSRYGLKELIKDLYGKRSAFTHSNTFKTPKEVIIEEDFTLISSILRLTVAKLMELREHGLKRIRKPLSEGASEDDSLDAYIEKLKKKHLVSNGMLAKMLISYTDQCYWWSQRSRNLKHFKVRSFSHTQK